MPREFRYPDRSACTLLKYHWKSLERDLMGVEGVHLGNYSLGGVCYLRGCAVGTKKGPMGCYTAVY